MDATSSSHRKPRQAAENQTPKAPSASSSSHRKLRRAAENRTSKAPFAPPAPSGDSHLASVQAAGAGKLSAGKGEGGYNLRKPHKSKAQSTTIDTKFSLSLFLKRVEKLNSRERAAIERVGFGGLLCLPEQTVARTLIAYLMDKWNPEDGNGKFELPRVKISLTPLDIALILGLRVTGKRVVLKDLPEYSESACLFTPTKKIPLHKIEKKLDEPNTESDFIMYFLLFTFATFLFPNPTLTVDSQWVPLLKNVDDINEYAWGLLVLDDLKEWLNARKYKRKRYVGGCILFLQIWSYEHFDVARPNFRSYIFPRAWRWEKCVKHDRTKIEEKFEDLSADQIFEELEPTSSELEVDIIKEFLKAPMDKSQETGPQSRMSNLLMDDDIDAETESVVDKMEKTHIFDAPKTSSSSTNYPFRQEDRDLEWRTRNLQVIKEFEERGHVLFSNPAYGVYR